MNIIKYFVRLGISWGKAYVPAALSLVVREQTLWCEVNVPNKLPHRENWRRNGGKDPWILYFVTSVAVFKKFVA